MKLLDLAFPLVKGCGKHRILFPQLTLTNCAGFGQHEFQCRNRMVRLSGRHTAEVPVFAVLNTVNNDQIFLRCAMPRPKEAARGMAADITRGMVPAELLSVANLTVPGPCPAYG